MLEFLKKPEGLKLSDIDPAASFSAHEPQTHKLDEIKAHLEAPLPDPDYENLLDYFPFPSMRGGQREVLLKLQEFLLDEETKYIILEAPTGAGKSGYAMALARAAKSAYVTTANKNLQEQYLRDFSDMLADMRGRANYKCRVFKDAENCAKCPCRETRGLARKCKENFGCEYHDALYEAATHDSTSFNFAAYLSFFNYLTDMFGVRNLLVLDEAHAAPEWLTNFIEVKVTRDTLRELALADEIPDYESAEFYDTFLKQIQKAARKFIDDDSVDEKTAEELESLDRKIALLQTLASGHWENFVTIKEQDRKTRGLLSVAFKPVNVSRVAQQFMLAGAKKTVFLSATILDFRTFQDMMGLPESQTKVLRIPSTFPKENRPIVLNRALHKLNADSIDMNLPKVCDQIRDLMDYYGDRKGIIHGNSYKICNFLMDNLRSDRIIYPKSSMEQRKSIEAHALTDDPSVLLSPSMEEGVDLKDDLARFQIIVKVPYPYLGDPVVQQRKVVYPNYYAWMTALTIAQAYGRAIRSPEDWAHTYILDAGFKWFHRQNAELFPKWFNEAVQWY